MMWWGNGMGWGGWIVMIVVLLAFWALVVAGVVAIFRGERNKRPAHLGEPNALDILDQRFARGEIDADEYQTRRNTLRARH